MPETSTPVVLVHGFFHGAWCWSEVVLELAALGCPSVAVDLAGHGLRARRPAAAAARPFDAVAFAAEPSGIAEVGLDETANLLVEQIRKVGRGSPVVLVGHSMGGAVLTRAAEQAPELMSRLIYLTGYMPASDVPCIAYPATPEGQGEQVMALLCGDPMSTGALRVDTRSPDTDVRSGLRSAFYQDVEEGVAVAAAALLGNDSPTAMAVQSTTLTANGWGAIPRTYVVCTEDHTIPPALQRLFITQADEAFPGNPTDVITLQSSHSPFLSMPDKVAAIIAAARQPQRSSSSVNALADAVD